MKSFSRESLSGKRYLKPVFMIQVKILSLVAFEVGIQHINHEKLFTGTSSIIHDVYRVDHDFLYWKLIYPSTCAPVAALSHFTIAGKTTF